MTLNIHIEKKCPAPRHVLAIMAAEICIEFKLVNLTFQILRSIFIQQKKPGNAPQETEFSV